MFVANALSNGGLLAKDDRPTQVIDFATEDDKTKHLS